MNAVVFAQDRVWLSGYLSAQNATFHSNSSSVQFFFSGISSGDSATVICGNGHTCTIGCNKNACNYLTLKCVNNSNECKFKMYCHSSTEFSINCPEGHKYHLSRTENSLPFASLASISFSFDQMYNNINRQCNLNMYNDTVICNDYKECAYRSNSFIDNKGPICCIAGGSCIDASTLSTMIESDVIHINDTNSSFNHDLNTNQVVAIRCDGCMSCYDVVYRIAGKKIGNIFLTGYLSGASTGATKIQASSNYNIYCTSYSCSSIRLISKAMNVLYSLWIVSFNKNLQYFSKCLRLWRCN